MNNNLYTAPSVDPASSFMDKQAEVRFRKIASAQKYVIFAILAYIIVAIAAAFTMNKVDMDTAAILGLGVIAIVIFGLVSAFRLASHTSGMLTAVFCLVGMLIPFPLIGLIILVVLNQKATKLLKQNGWKVGLLGAKKLEVTGPPPIQ